MGGEVPNEEAMRQAGINAYASKPVGQRELFDALAITLARARTPVGVRWGSDEDSRPAPPAALTGAAQEASDSFWSRTTS